jgi:hypothetical protein
LTDEYFVVLVNARRFVLLAVILPVVLAEPPAAPAPTASLPVLDPLILDKQLIAEAKNGSEMMANLTYLSDTISPRLTGSVALKKANEWAANKMRAYGLSNVHLEGWTIPSVGSAGWPRCASSSRTAIP